MGVDKRTLKIIGIVAVVVLIIGAIIGLLLGLLLPRRYVELEVWPRTEEYTWDQPLIEVRTGDAGSWHKWYQRINEFLLPYETSMPEDPPRAPCSTHNNREQHLRSEYCQRAMMMWDPCTADNFYGYKDGTPCVFLRLTNVHYWVPEPYNLTTSLPVPPDMPRHIRDAMQRQMHQPNQNMYQFADYIWVSCDGEFPADKENLGTIQYIPAMSPPGFPTTRLHTADRIPYATRNLPDPMPGPLVAVYFGNLRQDVLINVECRIWTRDIIYDRSSRVGRARFELFVRSRER